MPIGSITPGDPVTVSPDASLVPYTSVQAPTATMPVMGSDLQALTLVVLNIQDLVRGELASALAAMAVLFVTDDLRATSVFDVRSGQIHAAAGAIQIGGGSDVITVTGATLDLGNTDLNLGAAGNISSAGTNVFSSGSDTSFDGTAVLKTTNGGKFRWDTRNKADADYVANGTNGYEDILPDPAADRAITLANTGAALGQRKKFNAQNVTGANRWSLGYGAHTWFLRNVAGSTVKIEFVFDGSNWLVDDWEEGGSGLRNA